MQQSSSKPVVVVGGTSSGVGKTSIAVGLMAALRDNGLVVQAFKVGPDFIDPMHHERATGRPSINLDGWMLSREQVLATFQRHMADADIAVVEGVMGLFDGRDGATEAGSTSQMAKWLGAPVVLVLDCSALARSAGAVVKGYQTFDPSLRLEALLFNKVGGAAHTKWMADAVDSAGMGMTVLGGIPSDDAIAVQERYLGLHLPHDPTMPPNLISSLAAMVRTHVDLDALMALAATARLPEPAPGEEAAGELPPAPSSPPPALPSPAKGEAGRTDTAHQEGEDTSGCASGSGSGASAASGSDRGASAPGSSTEDGHRSVGSTSEDGSVASAMESLDPPLSDATNNEQLGAAGSHLREGEPGQQPALRSFHLDLPRALRPSVRIAVARDAAFCFYYHDNLALLAEAGAELVPFSPLVEALPPDISGVYLGGGYPERHAAELADNKLMRAGLRAFAQAGGVVYAECGGLLLLSQSLQPRGQPPQPMVGVFPFKSVMPPGKYSMGYVEVETTAACPLFPPGVKARGHVHHCSELVEEHHVGGVPGAAPAAADPGEATPSGSGSGWQAGYVARLQVPGAADAAEGFSHCAVLASYVHLHFGGCPELASQLVERCRGVDLGTVNAAVGGSVLAAAMLEGSCVHATPPSTAPPRTSLYPSHHSSPDLRRQPASARSHSVDLGRINPVYALHPPHPHHQQQHQGKLPPSGAAALGRVFSWSSLYSDRSGAPHQGFGNGELSHAQLMAMHQADRASTFSAESPLQLSPRNGGGSESGYHPHYHPNTHHAMHPDMDALPGPSMLHSALLQQQQQQHSPARHSLGNYPYHHQQQQQQYQQYHHHQQQARYSSSAHPEADAMTRSASWSHVAAAAAGGFAAPRDAAAGWHGHAQAATAGQPLSARLPHPNNGIWSNGGPGVSARSSNETDLAATPPALGGTKLTPGPLDLSALQRQEPTPGVRFPSGSATPHNWQHTCPPSDKVVTLGPGATEMAWALGLGNRVVGVSDTSDYPAEAATRAKVVKLLVKPPSPRTLAAATAASAGGPTVPTAGSSDSVSVALSSLKGSNNSLASLTAGSPGTGTAVATAAATAAAAAAEAAERAVLAAARGEGAPAPPFPCLIDEQVLARERPGLIVYEGEERGGSGKEGSAIGRCVLDAVLSVGLQQACRVVCVRRSTLADVFDSMIAVGEAAGVAEEASRTVDRLRGRLRRVAGEAARASARPRVLVLSSLQPLVTVGLWAPDAALLAGGTDGLQSPGDPPRLLSWEQLLAYAPEVLVIADVHRGTAVRVFSDLCHVASLPGWWLLPAVKSGQVFVVEAALCARAGPRLVDGVESLARMMHGDAVSVCCPRGTVLKLSLRAGQRCRPRLLPNYFMQYC